jgi:hypothetical protein
MSRRLWFCIFVALLALPLGCRRQTTPPPAPPPPPPSTELEGRLRATEDRLARTEAALVKSQEAIRDLQARADKPQPADPPVKPPDPKPAPAPRPEPAAPQITLAKYNAIDAHPLRLGAKVGASYQEVVKVMGVEGVEKSSDGRISRVAWDNADGTGAIVTFEILSSGRYATSKSQRGLK